MATRTETELAGGRHLRDYGRVLWQGRYTALAIFVAVVALAILRVMLATEVYEATTVVEIRPEARRIIPGQEQWVGAEGGGWLGEEKYFSTQLEILRGRNVAQLAFEKLGLKEHPEFVSASDPVASFMRRISVTPKVNTRLVRLSVRGHDPAEITEWANTLADTYVARNIDQATESFTRVLDQVQEELGELKATLNETDTQVTQSEAEKFENQEVILSQALNTYNERLTSARIQLKTLTSELNQITTARERGEDLLNIPRFYQDNVVQSLFSERLLVERALKELGAEKRASHPEYKAKLGELRLIDERLDEQYGRILDKLRSEYELAKSNVDFLETQIRSTEDEAFRLRQTTSNYEIATGTTASKRRVYDVVAETMERLLVSSRLAEMSNNVAVVEQAILPQYPVYPRRALSVAFGALLGMILGMGAVLFLDYVDNTIRTPDEVEQFLGLNLLGLIPKARTPGDAAAREAFQSLRTSVIFSSNNRERNLLLLTSAGPQEGKSSTTAKLARTLASAGDRVLVVDCDLRRPTQHQQFGVGREPGITNYLLEVNPPAIDHFTQPTDIPTLSVLACGPIPPNPPDLIGMSRFHTFLREAKRQYDWVLVDSPPVASLADSVLLASMVDMLLLVIKHNENDRDLIRSSLKRLREADVHVAGAVLNNVELSRSHYGYGYLYYSSDPEAEPGETKGRRRSADRSQRAG